MNFPSPCYVINEEKLLSNLKHIRWIQAEAGIEIILSYKAYAMWKSFPLFLDYIKSASASSLNEVLLCNLEMKTKAHTYCVAYHPNEFSKIVSGSSHIIFNSLSQYQTFQHHVPNKISIGLRINPGWSDVKTDLYNATDSHSRLGIFADNLPKLPQRVEGLHFHALCESGTDALETVLENIEKKFLPWLKQVRWINMGGGHLMTGEKYDSHRLISLLTAFKKKYHIKIILEPGSAFVWQVGDLHTTVLDIIKNGKVPTAIFDGSFTCHMPDCLEMPYKPHIEKASLVEKKGWYPYIIGGVSCLAGDAIQGYWFKKNVKVGDPIIFKDMIHYTMVKTTMFNGIKHPSIGMLKKNGIFKLIRTFGYTDYKNRLS